MTAVRRGVAAILRYLTPIYILLIFIQVFLAGEGIFGMKEGQSIEDATCPRSMTTRSRSTRTAAWGSSSPTSARSCS